MIPAANNNTSNPLPAPQPATRLLAGDSMCEAGILDGNYVVIEHRNTARNGEIVVALIRGEETTLKRIVHLAGGQRCLPLMNLSI